LKNKVLLPNDAWYDIASEQEQKKTINNNQNIIKNIPNMYRKSSKNHQKIYQKSLWEASWTPPGRSWTSLERIWGTRAKKMLKKPVR
jgi:hypothetical protein